MFEVGCVGKKNKRRFVKRSQLVSRDGSIIARRIDHAVVVAQLFDASGPLVCAVHFAHCSVRVCVFRSFNQ